MPTYDTKCSKCNKIVEVRTSKAYGTGEVVGTHAEDDKICGGELVKIVNTSPPIINGLSTPGISNRGQ